MFSAGRYTLCVQAYYYLAPVLLIVVPVLGCLATGSRSQPIPSFLLAHPLYRGSSHSEANFRCLFNVIVIPYRPPREFV